MSNIAIKVEHLTKTYRLYDRNRDRIKEAINPLGTRYSRDFYALNDISFEIKKGEVVGIIGENGAGKSTLLKILTGVLTPSEGKVEVNGKIAALLELGAGFNPELTGIENIYLNGTIMGFSKEEIGEKIQDIIDFADIGEFIEQPVRMYSSGMFARLAFAVNANVNPDILIVDEALAVGDMRFQIKCMDKMKDMMQGGTTILFVSHDINSVRRFCSHGLWFNHGTLEFDGKTEEVADRYEDFLKGKDAKKTIETKVEEGPANVYNIAEVTEFKILNKAEQEIQKAKYNEPIHIKVSYIVYDAKAIKNPILGIAIKSADDKYVCGLNTLLDNIKIPWKEGCNCFALDYTLGLLTTGGKYNFSVALFEETATVPVFYRAGIKELTITTPYIGEGTIIIPHKWGKDDALC